MLSAPSSSAAVVTMSWSVSSQWPRTLDSAATMDSSCHTEGFAVQEGGVQGGGKTKNNKSREVRVGR